MSATPANVRSETTRTQKARWRKGFPASRTFNEATYTVGLEGNEYYAYSSVTGLFFVSTTAQTVFDMINTDLTNLGETYCGIIHVKKGTYSVNIVLAHQGTILEGEGYGTIINGGTGGHAVDIQNIDCVVTNIQANTTAGGGNSYDAIHVSNGWVFIHRCWVLQSDRYGVMATASCYIDDCYLGGGIDDDAIYLGNARNHVENNEIYSPGGHGVNVISQANIICENIIRSAGDDGIFLQAGAEYCVASNNFIAGWTNEPIDNDTSGSVVEHNNCEGDVYTSKGCSFPTVQAAVDYQRENGFVELPDNHTFSENVIISGANMILRGHGYASAITGGSGTALTIRGNDCAVYDINFVTTLSSGVDAVRVSGGAYAKFNRVEIEESTGNGFSIYEDNCVLNDCNIRYCSNYAVYFDSAVSGGIMSKNFITFVSGTGGYGSGIGVYTGPTSEGIVISNNVIVQTASSGVLLSGYRHVCQGNRSKKDITDNSVGSSVGNNTIG